VSLLATSTFRIHRGAAERKFFVSRHDEDFSS